MVIELSLYAENAHEHDDDGPHVPPCPHASGHSLLDRNHDPIDLLLKISAAYSKRFCSPKWNDFKGVSLELHEKVRLNNLIWREWHRQVVVGQRTTPCGFACPVDDPVHYEPQAVVLEGKYWKRKYEAVTEQYRQWRVFWTVRRAWRGAKEQLESTKCILDEMAQQDNLSGQSSVAACSSQSFWDLDALLDAWIPSSASQCDLMNAVLEGPASHVVLAQLCPEAMSYIDVVQELLDSREDVMDIQASVTTVQLPSADTRVVDRHCSPLCPSVAIAQAISAMPPPTHYRKVRPSGRRRRVNVMNGVDILRDALPLAAGSNNTYLSKAKVMELAAASCRQMRQESAKMDEEVALMRYNVDQLRRGLSNAQMTMSTSGIPVSQMAPLNCNRRLFDAWVCHRSSENGKFAVFAQLIAPLFDSLMASVSVLDSEELSRSLLDWQREYFTLSTLRQSVLSSLMALSTSQSILASSDKFTEEVRARAWSESTDRRYGH